MSSLSLPTCKRCQRRKKKCDNRLPACSICLENGLGCIFYDAASDREIPRGYVAALDARVRELKQQLAAVRGDSGVDSTLEGPDDTDCLSASAPTTSTSSPSLDYGQTPTTSRVVCVEPVLAKCTASNLVLRAEDCGIHLGELESNSFPIVGAAWSTMRTTSTAATPTIALEDKLIDRNFVDQATIHCLVENHFLPIINLQYPIIDPSQVLMDAQIRRLDVTRRLFVCLSAAIAAAHQSRRRPEMYAVARFLRHWAGELTDAVFLKQDGDTFQALMLLILYEFVDPSSRMVWYLLSLACRMCVRLSWHRTLFVEEPDWIPKGHKWKPEYSYASIRRLFYLLYQWQRSVCSAFGRPSLLPDQLVEPLPASVGLSPVDASFQAAYLEAKLAKLLSSPSKDGRAPCIVSPELMHFTSAYLDRSSPLHGKLWLMMHSVVRHRCQACVHHVQWFSDISTVVIQVATSFIESEFERHHKDQVLSIWLSASLVFSAGNIVIDYSLPSQGASVEMPTENIASPPIKALMKCSNLLSSYAELHSGATIYRDIFAKFLDGIITS